jgi:hypothetical protein
VSVTDSMTFSSASLSQSPATNFTGQAARQRPAAQGGAVAVLLDDVEVALVVHVGEAEAARRDGDVLEPVEEVAVLGGAALEGDVGEREPAGALVRDERAALEVLDVRDLDGELAALLEAGVADVVDLDDELELLVEAAGLPMTAMVSSYVTRPRPRARPRGPGCPG